MGIEVPQAPTWWGVGIPLPTGEGSGRGLCPLPRKFFIFFSLKIPYFDAF